MVPHGKGEEFVCKPGIFILTPTKRSILKKFVCINILKFLLDKAELKEGAFIPSLMGALNIDPVAEHLKLNWFGV